jgi:hypothetical protein
MVGVDFLGLGVGMILATVATVKVQQSLFTKGADGEKKYTPESR